MQQFNLVQFSVTFDNKRLDSFNQIFGEHLLSTDYMPRPTLCTRFQNEYNIVLALRELLL